MILRGIFHVVSGFPFHFMLYRGNLDLDLTEFGQCTGKTVGFLFFLKRFSK